MMDAETRARFADVRAGGFAAQAATGVPRRTTNARDLQARDGTAARRGERVGQMG